MQKTYSSRPYTQVLIAFIALVIILGIVFNGVSPLILFIQFIVLASAALLIFTRSGLKPELKVLSLFIAMGLLVVTIIALVGFYTGSRVTGYNTSGTWVANHNLGTAIGSSLFDPVSFTATIGGYDCNGTWGNNCSSVLYYVGFSVVELSLAGSVVAGSLMSTRQGRSKPFSS